MILDVDGKGIHNHVNWANDFNWDHPCFFYAPYENTKQTYTILIVNVGMPCIILSSILKVEIDQSIFKDVITVFRLSLSST